VSSWVSASAAKRLPDRLQRWPRRAPASVRNLRDRGVYKAGDGAVVRYGVAYRSNELNPISPDDMKKVAALGLKNDSDLRTADERKERPNEPPPGVNNV
jgi:protein-tyrosine phosphatase